MRNPFVHIVVGVALVAGLGMHPVGANAAHAPDVAPSSATPTPADIQGANAAVKLLSPPSGEKAESGKIQLAQYYKRRYGPRYRAARQGYRHYYRGYYYANPWWRPAPAPGRYAGQGHVQWCLNRYRSYDPRTDQYLGYDGYYHWCRSPYR